MVVSTQGMIALKRIIPVPLAIVALWFQTGNFGSTQTMKQEYQTIKRHIIVQKMARKINRN